MLCYVSIPRVAKAIKYLKKILICTTPYAKYKRSGILHSNKRGIMLSYETFFLFTGKIEDFVFKQVLYKNKQVCFIF